MAELFEWSDDFNVGVSDIDEQHLELVALINRMHAAIHQRRGSRVVRQTLADLVDYTRSHFAVEERLMQSCDYPEYELHKSYHEALIDQVSVLQEKLETQGLTSSFELLHFLRVWLIRHICDVDRRFGEFYLLHGSRPAWMEEAHAELTSRRWWQFWRHGS